MKGIEDNRVLCDKCGKEVKIEVWDRAIGKDQDGFEIVETYFTCRNCGKHYTVGVYDQQMRHDIQKRRRLQSTIRLHIQIGSRPKTIEHFRREERKLAIEMAKRSKQLKEKYRNLCENTDA